jgi:hypothetical protein
MTAPLDGPRRPAQRSPRPAGRARWPDAGTPLGAVLYAVLGGLILWILERVLPHIHIAISWH